ncbi:MAG: SLBB domain-containing protein, partial [Flavobacteriaceae bacterium]
MRYLFVIILISLSGFSQTNEAVINQAVQTAKSQNITTKSQAVKALEASGMTENQARQLARQRGLSYDQLLNQYFSGDANSDSSLSKDPGSEILQDKNETDKEDEETLEATDFRIKGQTVNYFGYNIFENNPYLNKEYLLGNIDEGYLIAPGDKIRIITYGDNSFEQNVTVDRNGNVNIQGYGLFFASGNTFKTFKERLKIFLGKYLSGLVSNPQKTFMDVSLTELRPTKIVVLGQVESPGPHILNTSGSALSALYAAGGVKYSGSLREVIIYRNNKLLKKIDLYDYITTGELKDDVRLTNNDIVFVPNRKNSIEVKGEVLNPAIYETLENEDLTTLVKFSGGILPTTQTNKVNIQRIIPASERTADNIIDRKLITINYQELIDNNKKIDLENGDQVTFFRILDLQSDQVTIKGHVFEPGTYSLKTFSNLKSLILDGAKGYLPDVYFEKVEVYSTIDGIESVNSYSLTDILFNEKEVSLKDLDVVYVYSNQRVEGDKTISISGFGTQPSTISWKENFSLFDMIFGNTQIKNPEFTTEFLDTRIDLKRFNDETGNYFSIKYDFNDLENLKNTMLMPRDKVILYSNNTTENTDKKVGIYGYVKNGDAYDLEENMYVEDLILLAGGFDIEADQKQVTVNRLEINSDEERIIRKYNYSVDTNYLKGISNEPNNKFVLQDNDILTIKKLLGYDKPSKVKVIGEVNDEQTVILEYKNTSFSEIIDYAGGLTKYANLESSILKRDGKIITLDFNKIRSSDDMIFMDGDEIIISSKRGIVSTVGAVENESNFIWKKGLKSKSYIRNSGGKVKKEGDNSYIIYPNGKTKKI